MKTRKYEQCLWSILLICFTLHLQAQDELTITPSGVGVFVNSPQSGLDVGTTLFVRSNLGGIEFGYPDDGNRWRKVTTNAGADILHRFKPTGNGSYITRMVQYSNGDLAVGGGPGISSSRLEVILNSSPFRPHVLLTEEGDDFSRIWFESSSNLDSRWSIQGYANSVATESEMTFRYENPSGAADRFTILGNGNVGIGNSAPDEKLVVGDNLGTGYTLTAISAGGTSGGAFICGNGSYKIGMDASNTFQRGRIYSTAPGGFGKGSIEIRANGGVSIGDSPGTPDGYMVKIEHGSFGLDIENSSSGDDWEFYTSGGGDLFLYSNGAYRGRFDAVTGAYTETSDRRLKTDIRPLGSVIDLVMSLEPVRFTYIADASGQQTVGFIAQDVAEVFPSAVKGPVDDGRGDYYGVAYSKFTPIAIGAIQELKTELDARDRRISELEARLTALEQLVGD